jgi:tripartite-type tricarboxylate transporter receptor subunit TctC
MRRRTFALGALAPPALALGGLAAPALLTRAQTGWPSRPVRVINPYSPGGTTDVVMRLMSERLERAFGQPFPVESRPGAGGSVGTAAAALATDGHTLLITNTGPLAVAPAMIPNLSYDPARAFAYVTLFGGAPILCAVRAGSPIGSVADYAAAARARPETVSYGNSGAGSMGHLAGLAFEQAAGVRLLHVPFRGAPEAQAAVLAGDTVSIWDTVGAHAGALRQGSLRPLGFTSAARVPLFPEVPTLAEAGFPAVVVTNWFLLAGPAGLPEAAAARINAVCQAAMREPAVAERMAALMLVSLGDPSPAEIRDFVLGEAARWGPVVRAAGIAGGG